MNNKLIHQENKDHVSKKENKNDELKDVLELKFFSRKNIKTKEDFEDFKKEFQKKYPMLEIKEESFFIDNSDSQREKKKNHRNQSRNLHFDENKTQNLPYRFELKFKNKKLIPNEHPLSGVFSSH